MTEFTDLVEIFETVEAAMLPDLDNKVEPIWIASWPYAWYVGVQEVGFFMYDNYDGNFTFSACWGNNKSSAYKKYLWADFKLAYPTLGAMLETMRTAVNPDGDIPGLTCSMTKLLYFTSPEESVQCYAGSRATLKMGQRYAQGTDIDDQLWIFNPGGGAPPGVLI